MLFACVFFDGTVTEVSIFKPYLLFSLLIEMESSMAMEYTCLANGKASFFFY